MTDRHREPIGGLAAVFAHPHYRRFTAAGALALRTRRRAHRPPAPPDRGRGGHRRSIPGPRRWPMSARREKALRGGQDRDGRGDRGRSSRWTPGRGPVLDPRRRDRPVAGRSAPRRGDHLWRARRDQRCRPCRGTGRPPPGGRSSGWPSRASRRTRCTWSLPSSAPGQGPLRPLPQRGSRQPPDRDHRGGRTKAGALACHASQSDTAEEIAELRARSTAIMGVVHEGCTRVPRPTVPAARPTFFLEAGLRGLFVPRPRPVPCRRRLELVLVVGLGGWPCGSLLLGG